MLAVAFWAVERSRRVSRRGSQAQLCLCHCQLTVIACPGRYCFDFVCQARPFLECVCVCVCTTSSSQIFFHCGFSLPMLKGFPLFMGWRLLFWGQEFPFNMPPDFLQGAKHQAGGCTPLDLRSPAHTRGVEMHFGAPRWIASSSLNAGVRGAQQLSAVGCSICTEIRAASARPGSCIYGTSSPLISDYKMGSFYLNFECLLHEPMFKGAGGWGCLETSEMPFGGVFLPLPPPQFMNVVLKQQWGWAWSLSNIW